MTVGDPCERCQHSIDPHFVIATTGDPLDGGIIICHVKGCLCFATFDVPQLGTYREDVVVPNDEELAAMRQRFQTEEA